MKVNYSTTNIISDASQLLNNNWLRHIGVWVLYFVVCGSISACFLPHTPFPSNASPATVMMQSLTDPSNVVHGLVTSFLSLLFTAGYMRMCLDDIDGKKSGLNSFLQPAGVYVNAIVASILVSFVCLIGFMLLIVPGVIFWIRLSMVTPYIIDQRLDFSEAIKASWRDTKGNGWSLFGSLILLIIVMCAGYLLCCVGILYTMPLYLISLTMLYRVISGASTPQQIEDEDSAMNEI